MEDVSEDLLFSDIGLAIIFIDVRTGMNDSIHVQVEIIKIRDLHGLSKSARLPRRIDRTCVSAITRLIFG